MKPSHSQKPAPGRPDFKLEHWKGPTREFRFVGWRNDFTAFYLLDDGDTPFVLKPGFPDAQFPLENARISEPAVSIKKARLLPPPWRDTRTEADLLRNFPQLPEARAAADLTGARELYFCEARKRELQHFQPPEPWELLYEDAIAPETDIVSNNDADHPTPLAEKFELEKKEAEMRTALVKEWARQHAVDLKRMEIDCKEFLRRYPGIPVFHQDRQALLARIRYKMEFKGLVTIWLCDYHLGAPQVASDIDQIRQFVGARPDLVRLTPEAAENELGLKLDSKHRSLESYCRVAGLDLGGLTRADLPRLFAIRNDRKAAKGRAAAAANRRRRKNS